VTETKLRYRLEQGLAELGIAIDQHQIDALLNYLNLLQQWNQRFNLTAIRDPLDMVTRHLLDSLAVLPHLEATSIVDVGSGAGLPGIPLSILLPGSNFCLLDSNGKKTRFMTQVKTQLGLVNVSVVKARVEDFRPETKFELVLSRAFASLSDMIDRCGHLVDHEGTFLAMKGLRPNEELLALDASDSPVELLSIVELSIPGLKEERCLLRLRNKHPSS
jgi:16S rRNA (guanine527-N7)-methyltransferase